MTQIEGMHAVQSWLAPPKLEPDIRQPRRTADEASAACGRSQRRRTTEDAEEAELKEKEASGSR